VVVSYFEWVQANQAYWWTKDEVNARLEDHMQRAWTRVLDYSQDRGVSMRVAATTMAVETVTSAQPLPLTG
jgi:glutamate dehydrogenase (NAD(P)+)